MNKCLLSLNRDYFIYSVLNKVSNFGCLLLWLRYYKSASKLRFYIF